MLKSRRGLLAAGLAVAVVGALGAASTLSAGAEQIPGAPDTSAAVAAAPDSSAVAAAPDSTAAAPDSSADAAAQESSTAGQLAPPPVLPWGAQPSKIRNGKPGASSSALRAAGLAAALPDANGSTTPQPKYGPKGRTSRTTFLKNERTNIAPPVPAPASSTTASSTTASSTTASSTTLAASEVTYLYNVGSQAAATDGVYANMTISKPDLSTSDYHTLGELALQSADGRQIVEVGWNVDRVVNGDDDPHLFVYHWVNRTSSCYNSCGFVPYSLNVTAGSTLSYDVTKKFGIQYFQGAWWIAFDSEWIGFFPEALWNLSGVTFNRSGLVQVFGEVAATSSSPCTEMGNGETPDNESAARMASVTYLNGPTVSLNIRTTTSVYSVNALSGRTFRYGGPGAC
ncbi:MAG TPA: neprosin family prolyl endopeptidase [Actinoplanes sp.]